MSVWVTKQGQEIPYEELTDTHLLNILKFIENLAQKGYDKTILSWDPDLGDTPIGETITLYGKDVFDEFDYYELLDEAKRRGLVRRR